MGSPSREQREAIRFYKGPCLVLAGPGSGKTFVITERIRTLITVYGARPSGILALTYSRAAAEELARRTVKTCGHAGTAVSFGTFHSIFLRFLRSYAGRTDTLISDREKRDFFLDVLKRKYGDTAEEKLPPALRYLPDAERTEILVSAVSLMKSAVPGREKELMERQYPGCADHPLFRSLAGAYESYLRRRSLLDYEDMLLQSYRLLRDDQALRERFAGQYSFILVDEFQDMNGLQFELLRLLLKNGNNLFAVGDDDQSIYAFRGAVPEIARTFTSVYPNCARIFLSVNFRCAPAILKASGLVIRENTVRIEKQLRSGAPAALRSFHVRSYPGREEQFAAQREKIRRFLNRGESCAVIFRSHYQEALLMRTLALGSGRVPSPVRRADGTLAPADEDGTRIYTVCRLVSTGLSLIYRETESTDETDGRIRMLYMLQERIGIRADRILRMAGSGVQAPLQTVLASFWEAGAIESVFDSGGGPDSLRFLKEELYEAACRALDLKDFLARVQSRAEASLLPPRKEELLPPFHTDLLQICTMHGAKGLEFDHVFVPDLNEGVIPTRRAVSEALIEEERRLLYVAMTRARKSLDLSYVTGNDLKRVPPSRFIRPFLTDPAVP